MAFVDPETGNAWVGSGIDIGQKFYLETETGIICGTVLFWGPIVLGAPRRDINGVIVGSEVGGRLNWDRSFVPRVKRGENVDAAIEQFNKTIDLKSVGRMPEESFTPLGDNLRRVENGLDPWLFQDEGHGSQFKVTTVEAIDVSDGKLRLDLKNPTGSHKASVWIDLKTWKLVKAVEDGKGEFSIVFDNRPEDGMPLEAEQQEGVNTSHSAGVTNKKLSDIVGDSIQTVRVRYFSTNTWANEAQVRDYIAGLLTDKLATCSDLQIWSEGVGTPQIDCLIDFTDSYRSKLHRRYYEGKLLVWNTEACFREATGKWWFVNIFDYFHSHHPSGERNLSREKTGK